MADLSLHSRSTNFAQWFFRKVYSDWEDRIRVGLVGGEGILVLQLLCPISDSRGYKKVTR